MKKAELKEFLDFKVEQFNTSRFIENDPIQIPHQFSNKHDIEISAWFSAILAWGQRITIIKNTNRLMDLMDRAPYDFIMGSDEIKDEHFSGFVHRTFNSIDALFMVRALKHIYTHKGGLEEAFSHGSNTFERINNFRKIFLEVPHEKRSEKHISAPEKGSAAKRINMYLRWMVRKDPRGVDFGLWNNYPTSDLMLPLDVHTGNVARKLGLLKRKNNDWRALEELMKKLRDLDPEDPVKYDFALFGLGESKEI